MLHGQLNNEFLIDKSILRDVRLSAIDRVVYFYLASCMNHKEGTCSPTYATIKGHLGISRSSINRATKHLKRLKLIKVKRLAFANLYFMTRQRELHTIYSHSST
jgi:hypothetical protein